MTLLCSDGQVEGSDTITKEQIEGSGSIPDEFISNLNLVHSSTCFGIVITDRNQQIQFLNEVFVQETGYTLKEVMGKNTNILQGSETSKSTTAVIRSALTQENPQPIRIGLLNYRKDGSSFWNKMFISPLFDGSGRVTHFVGVQLYKMHQSPQRSVGLGVFPWISPSELDKQKQLGIVIPGPGHKHQTHSQTTFISETNLPTKHGIFRVRAYRVNGSHMEPLAIISNIEGSNTLSVPVRIHDQCFTSEVLGSLKCDCKEQLEYSMGYIKRDRGVVIYLQQEGRGMGLANKLKAYSLQEHGFDTVDANQILGFEDDTRDYSSIPGILSDLGVQSIQLMTNNPRKLELISSLGVQIDSRISVDIPSNPHSDNYLHTKTCRMGHIRSNFD